MDVLIDNTPKTKKSRRSVVCAGGRVSGWARFGEVQAGSPVAV